MTARVHAHAGALDRARKREATSEVQKQSMCSPFTQLNVQPHLSGIVSYAKLDTMLCVWSRFSTNGLLVALAADNQLKL